MANNSIKYSISKLIMYLILIGMAVSPAFALGAGARNLFLIGIMSLSPLVIILYPHIYMKDATLLILSFLLMTCPLLFNSQTMRWSTVLYGVMFCLNFMAYNRLLKEDIIDINEYVSLLKWIIYSYAIVLLIQQFCVLTGLPIFNVSNYSPLTPWKLNSLTSEPSHSVRYMALFMYSFIAMNEKIRGVSYSIKDMLHEDRRVWIAFMWVMITSISATGYLFLLVILSKFINLKNLVVPCAAIALIIFIGLQQENESVVRMYNTGLATLTLDEKTIVKADHSGSARIVPVIIAAKMVDLRTKEGWFGHGVDYLSTVMYKLFPGVNQGYTGGGIFLLAVEYGFLTFLIFLIFSFRATFRRDDLVTLLFFALMCINEGLNMQITWSAIIFLYTNKHMLGNLKQKMNK